MKKKGLFATIPVYNPGEIIQQVVHKTLNHIDNIILIDDGCDQENKRIIKQLSQHKSITLLTHKVNQGKGFAIHTGIEHALKQGAKTIILLDSDGQHRPEELLRFISFADNNDFQLVVGTRTEIDKMPLRSKIGNVSMAKIFGFLYGQKLKDTQSGYRMMSAEFARKFLDNVKAGRYETEMQMLIYAAKSKISINEIPITTQYFDGNSNSKFRPITDSLRVLGSFAKYSGVGFLSFLIDYTLFITLTSFFGVYFLTSHIVSRIFSGSFNFFANKKYVFNHLQSTKTAFIKYLVAVAVSLSISSLLLYIFVDAFTFKTTTSKIFAEASTFLLNYYILKHFVFRQT
jgi:glycosyltransferase involved in cell wall biosynthesis